MKELIAIIAPMLIGKQYEADFRVVMNSGDQELNLPYLYDLIKNNYILKPEEKRYNYGKETIPAAGYLLSSTLRIEGYDTFLTQSYDDITLQKIAGKNPLAICISTTMILTKSDFIQLMRKIRKYLPDISIIIGGIFALKSFIILEKRNYYKKEYEKTDWELFDHYEKEYEHCFFITSHHGMNSLFRILNEIKKGTKGNYGDIPNLIYSHHQNFSYTHYKMDIIDLDKEYIHWDLIDTLPKRIPFSTSIGCPYRCEYCDFCVLYPSLQKKSIQSIQKELILLKNLMESRHTSAIINFTDDNIFFSQKRLENICHVIINSEINIPWIGLMRASSINEASIPLLKESNQFAATIGIESGDVEILKAMNKKQDLQQVREAIELLDKNRIFTILFFLIGFPGETAETVNNTASFINSLELHNLLTVFQLYTLTILPLSNLTTKESRKKWKIEGIYSTWKHATMDSEQAKKERYRLFKRISKISYLYLSESTFFLFRFNYEQRKKLFDLRKKLTIALYEQEPMGKIQSIITDIALIMGLHASPPGEAFIKQLKVHG